MVHNPVVDRLADEFIEGSRRAAVLRSAIAGFANSMRDSRGSKIVLEVSESGMALRSPGLDCKLHTDDDYCRQIPK
jgi:hypothetical protein